MMHVFAGSVLRWPAPSYSHALRLPGSCALSSGDLLHACCADCWVHTVSATRFPMRSEHRTVFDRIRVCLYKLDFIAIAPGLWWQQRGLDMCTLRLCGCCVCVLCRMLVCECVQCVASRVLCGVLGRAACGVD